MTPARLQPRVRHPTPPPPLGPTKQLISLSASAGKGVSICLPLIPKKLMNSSAPAKCPGSCEQWHLIVESQGGGTEPGAWIKVHCTLYWAPARQQAWGTGNSCNPLPTCGSISSQILPPPPRNPASITPCGNLFHQP